MEECILNIQNVKRLIEFDSPTVANGLEMLDVIDPSAGYTGPDIRALMPELGARVGIAVAARMDTTSPGTDNPPSLFEMWVRLIKEISHSYGIETMPVFAVIESVGPRPRYTVTIGDGMGTIMKMAGATAFLTNGCIRDLEGVRAIPLACWAAGLSPMHGKIRWLDINSPVVIDGVTIKTGDVIHADINGALLIPATSADQVLSKALLVRQQESALFAKLGQPGMTIEKHFSG